MPITYHTLFITMNKPAPTTSVSDGKALLHKKGLIGCIGSVDATHIPLSKATHCDNNTGDGLNVAFLRNEVECVFGTLTGPFEILSVPSRNNSVTVDESSKIIENTVDHKITNNK